jgi:hypothetical protein
MPPKEEVEQQDSDPWKIIMGSLLREQGERIRGYRIRREAKQKKGLSEYDTDPAKTI